MLRCPYRSLFCYCGRNVFSVSLTVDPEDDETELFGKEVGELQSGIYVHDDHITGTLKYVTDYTGFSGNPELQKGNFLALKFEATEGSTTTVEVLGGHSGPVTLDEDMNIVLRIENKYSQKIKVVTTKSGISITRIFGLGTLNVEEE